MIQRIKRHLNVPFYMEIVILMTGDDLEHMDQTIQACKDKLKIEIALVIHRTRRTDLGWFQREG
jgi:hypothetical protein